MANAGTLSRVRTGRERLGFVLNGVAYIVTAAVGLVLAALLLLGGWKLATSNGSSGSLSGNLPTLAVGVFGALLGACVPIGWSHYRRAVERRGELAAILVEFRRCEECFSAYLKDGVGAPLYRIPHSALSIALPKLVGDGSLDIDETGILVRYLSVVEEINRGLERCGAAASQGNQDLLNTEFNRLTSKMTTYSTKGEERWQGMTLLEATFSLLARLTQ